MRHTKNRPTAKGDKMLKIKGNEANPIIKAMKAEQTAQAIQAEAEQKTRIKTHFLREVRNEARRQARREAEKTAQAIGRGTETQETPLIIISEAIGNPTPNTADRIQYLIKYEEEKEPKKTAKPLSNKSFIVLYNSKRIIYNGERLNKETHEERIIINYLKTQNPFILLTENGEEAERTNQLKQVSYNLYRDIKTPQAKKYLLSFRGEAEKAGNHKQRGNGTHRPIISYTNIGYEPNEIILIGREADINQIIRIITSKNKPHNQFYNFINKLVKDPRSTPKKPKFNRVKDTNPKQRRKTETVETTTKTRRVVRERGERQKTQMLKNLRRNKEYIEANKEKQASLINYCLYHTQTIREIDTKTKTQTIGLNNITEHEKKALKQIQSRRNTNTQETAEELLKIAEATDGRQTIKNIEYDLKTNPLIKGLKSEKSSTLYFIMQRTEEEEKTKKTTALNNVLLSYMLLAELREETQESIEEQQKEADKRQETFKGDKKSKNKYNTKIGLQKPNRRPTAQEEKQTRKNQHITNPQVLAEIREETEENKKAKRTALLHLQLINEVQEEKTAENRKEEARKHNTRELNKIRKIKEERKKARRQEKTQNPAQIFNLLVRENEKERVSYQKARRIKQQARNRHITEKDTKQYIISLYGEKQTEKEYRMLKADHKNDLIFKKASEI